AAPPAAAPPAFHVAAEVGLFVLGGGGFKEFFGLFRVGDLEDAGGAAAGGAAGAVGVVDVDVVLAEEGGDVGQGAGAIRQVQAQDFGLGHGEVQLAEHLAGGGGVVGDEPQDPM